MNSKGVKRIVYIDTNNHQKKTEICHFNRADFIEKILNEKMEITW